MNPLAVFVLLVLNGVVVVFGDFPAGYILDVSPDCRSVAQGSAKITVKSDLPVSVSTKCNKKAPTSIAVGSDKVTYVASLDYNTAGTCAFRSDAVNGVKVYTGNLIVAWGGSGSEVLDQSEQWLITCSFDAKGDATVSAKTVSSALLAPEEIQRNEGSATSDTLILQLTDVLGNNIAGSSVPLGKMVQLTASVAGSSLGLRATSCDAIGSTDNSYISILTAGCGNGRIFLTTEGFTTMDKTLTSPFFPYFKIDGNTAVSFKCNFTTCVSKKCNGDSCQSRKRRSTNNGMLEPEIPVYASTQVIGTKLPSKGNLLVVEGDASPTGSGRSSSVLIVGAVAATLSIVSICISLYACSKRLVDSVSVKA